MTNTPLESPTTPTRASREHGTDTTTQKERRFTTSLDIPAEERGKFEHKVKLFLEEDIERALNVINLLQETSKMHFNDIDALNDKHLIVMPPLVRLLEDRLDFYMDVQRLLEEDNTRVGELNSLNGFLEDGASGAQRHVSPLNKQSPSIGGSPDKVHGEIVTPVYDRNSTNWPPQDQSQAALHQLQIPHDLVPTDEIAELDLNDAAPYEAHIQTPHVNSSTHQADEQTTFSHTNHSSPPQQVPTRQILSETPQGSVTHIKTDKYWQHRPGSIVPSLVFSLLVGFVIGWYFRST